MVNKILRRITSVFIDNIIVNNFAIVLNFENKLKNIDKHWIYFSYDSSKSLQENVGFSHKAEVEEALLKTHKDLVSVAGLYLIKGDSILDIGCGTGLYLEEFSGSDYMLYGIDMSKQMINVAKQHLPNVHFVIGDFMRQKIDRKFNLIYSISVLEYISRTDMHAFFRKLHTSLAQNGIIFIHYPHALSAYDLMYPDLNYIKYSPYVVERISSKYFDILSHKHGFDNRIVKRFDANPYKSTRGTFKNGYLLIARKKSIID